MSRRLRDAFASVILAVLAVLAWPITPWGTVAVYDVTITATGAKNARSNGTEVWLHGLPSGMDPAALVASRSTPQGWERRDGSIVSYQDQPSVIRFHGELPADEAFTFGRHGWSGHVTIAVNGTSRSEDLFDADAGAFSALGR